MNKISAIALVTLGVWVAACSPQAPTLLSTTATPTRTLPHRTGILRFSLNGPADILDVPRLIALDSLKEQGYTVEQVIFADQSLMAEALIRGDIEFASNDTGTAWASIVKGADVRTIVGRTNTTVYLVGKQNLQVCRDLNGRPIAMSTNALGLVMFDKYLKQHCPNVVPQMAVINGSVNRVAALQAGTLDAARLELADWMELKRQAPGKFNILIDFGREFPQVAFTTFSVRRAWAAQNPDAVKDFLRALLSAQRSIIANPRLLRDAIVKYLSIDSDRAQEIADTYLSLNAWDANGGLTDESVQYTIDFLTTGGTLPTNVKPNDLADLSYLNAVLDEIGRK